MSIKFNKISTFSNALQSIDWGTQVSGPVITYSFGPAGTGMTIAEELGLGESYTGESFTAYEQQQFRAALDLIASVTGLQFVEVTNYASADLRFLVDTNEFGPSDLGAMLPPGELGAGLGVFAASNWDRGPGGDLEFGGFGFVTIVHEILHGLGLAHPHDTGGTSPIMTGVTSAFDDLGPYNLNQGVFTIMTYNSGLIDGGGVGRPSSAQNWGYEAGPMALDIAVLQDKYGTNTNYNNGNTIYDLPDQNASGTYWSAIWDTGGTDMIRYQGSRDVTIDLRTATLKDATGGGGYLSAADGIEGGFTIANGVVIERAQGGSGDDTLIGNSARNTLNGGGGNDSLKGGGGNDRLNADKGNDTLSGGNGQDMLNGGTGNDRAFGQRGNDTLNGGKGNDLLNGGGDRDKLNGGNGSDFLKGGNRNDVLNGGKGNDRLFGNRNDDTINGGAGRDVLNGGGNDDRLNGGAGNDTLKGGTGADEFVFGEGGDRDVILDFNTSEDRLRIDADLLAGQSSGQAVVNAYGSVQGGHVVLDFGDGDVLTVNGVSSLNDVASQIDII